MRACGHLDPRRAPSLNTSGYCVRGVSFIPKIRYLARFEFNMTSVETVYDFTIICSRLSFLRLVEVQLGVGAGSLGGVGRCPSDSDMARACSVAISSSNQSPAERVCSISK